MIFFNAVSSSAGISMEVSSAFSGVLLYFLSIELKVKLNSNYFIMV